MVKHFLKANLKKKKNNHCVYSPPHGVIHQAFKISDL